MTTATLPRLNRRTRRALARDLAVDGHAIVGGGDGPVDGPSPLARVLATLTEARDANKRKLGEIVAGAEARAADARKTAHAAAKSEDERKAAEALPVTYTADEVRDIDRISEEMAPQNLRIAEIAQQVHRDERAGQALVYLGETGTPARVAYEPRTYQNRGPNRRNSYFQDMFLAQRDNDETRWERLRRHATEVERDAADDNVETRAMSRTDGSGGYLVPPLWLIDEYVALARAGRVTADLCTQMDLPDGTDSINIPAITTGTAVAIQTADNATVSNQDIVDNVVTLPVRTIAGYADAALQLIEQSPLGAGLDQLLFTDLAADYAAKLDVQVINGSGSSGQVTGFLNTSSINAVTYTQASPTLVNAYPALAQALSQVAKNRYLPATAFVTHPSEWYFWAQALDTQNRPLVVPSGGAFNAMSAPDQMPAQGRVGEILGIPLFVDPNVPTNLGGGTNETRLIAARFPDIVLMEGNPRTSIHTDVLSASLGVRFRFYNYVAFSAARYPKSTSVVSGTGMIVQSGY